MDNKEKLNAAFSALRKAGFIAKQNFSCCGSCAGAEIATSVGKMTPARRERVKGAVTYNRQSSASAWGRWGKGWLYIGYGPVSVHNVGEFGLPTEEVGQALVAALKEAGLEEIDWNGSPNEKIGVRV